MTTDTGNWESKAQLNVKVKGQGHKEQKCKESLFTHIFVKVDRFAPSQDKTKLSAAYTYTHIIKYISPAKKRNFCDCFF